MSMGIGTSSFGAASRQAPSPSTPPSPGSPGQGQRTTVDVDATDAWSWLQAETRDVVDLHPRLPHDRTRSETPKPAASDEQPKRSPVAQAAITTSFIGGGVKSALDLGRVAVKLPEAARNGKLAMALRQAALIAPNTNLIDPNAPRVASAASHGMSFTKLDEVAYKSSSLLGAGLAAVQFGSSIPNLIDAVHTNGMAGLADTTSGRSGVLQFVGGGLGLGMYGAALWQTRGSGEKLISRLITASGNPIMTRPLVTAVGIGMGVAAMANEVGYFDFMNRGETRSVPTVMRDATRRIPVANDPTLRTIALSAITGGAAIKAVRGAIVNRSIMGGGKAALITGVLGAGLLAAQATGLLHGIDKPN